MPDPEFARDPRNPETRSSGAQSEYDPMLSWPDFCSSSKVTQSTTVPNAPRILNILGPIDDINDYVTVSIKKEIREKIKRKPMIIEFYLNPNMEQQKFMRENSVSFEWSKIDHDY